VRALLADIDVQIYAEVGTPSGGAHFYVAGHPDLPNVAANADRDGLAGWSGVEILSHGRHVFLPGTARAKYGGRGYTIVRNNLAALADGGDDDSAEALASWVAANRVRPKCMAPDAPLWDGTPLDERQRKYLDAALRDESASLAAMGPNSGRNNALNVAALKLGGYVAGAGLGQDEVVDALMDACVRNGLVAEDGERSVAATIKSGLRYGLSHPKAVPPALGDDIGPSSFETGNGDKNASGAIGVDVRRKARRLVLTRASEIRPKRVRWLWEGRVAIGTIALLAGREGLGKSTVSYWLASMVTRGLLPGEHLGVPRSVLVCATEDSWEHTIVPRLIAAGADLDKVQRVEVETAGGVHGTLSLPADLEETEAAITETGASLLILDPLTSRLTASLDTHKDADVRRALEPLAALADRSRIAVVGLMHHNKSATTDPLTLVMGSRAFTAVARSVHTVVPDPDDDEARLFGTVKNNLGRIDLPSLPFRIEPFLVPTDDGDAETGRVVWGEPVAGSIGDALRRAAARSRNSAPTATDDAADWLRDYLTANGAPVEALGPGRWVESADVKKAAAEAGHSDRPLLNARGRLGVRSEATGFPRRTWWALPAKPSGDTNRDVSWGEVTTEMNEHEYAGQPSRDSRDLETGTTLLGSRLDGDDSEIEIDLSWAGR